MAGQSTGFYQLVTTTDPNVWYCSATQKHLSHGFREFYVAVKGNSGQCGTQILGLPITEEYTGSDGLTYQDFERVRLCYNAKQSGPWQISCASVVSGDLASLQHQMLQLQQQLAQAEAQITALQSGSPGGTSGGSTTGGGTLTEAQQALAAFQTLKSVLAQL